MPFVFPKQLAERLEVCLKSSSLYFDLDRKRGGAQISLALSLCLDRFQGAGHEPGARRANPAGATVEGPGGSISLVNTLSQEQLYIHTFVALIQFLKIRERSSAHYRSNRENHPVRMSCRLH